MGDAVDTEAQRRQDAGVQGVPVACSRRQVLVRFLFEDEARSTRSLDQVRDPALLDAIAPIRRFVDNALMGLSCDELDVVFWEDENGVLKMTLRGHDDMVHLAKSLIGDRAAIPPAQN